MSYDFQTWRAAFFSELMLVHVSSKKLPIETFNISFECTRNMQQYGSKITCTEVRVRSYCELKFVLEKLWFLDRTILLSMILNGKGSNWLWSTWVQSCFCSCSTGQSNIAGFFKLNIGRDRETNVDAEFHVFLFVCTALGKDIWHAWDLFGANIGATI